MNRLNDRKRPIALAEVNAYAGIIQPLDETKQMRHRGMQTASVSLVQRDKRRTKFFFATDARSTISPLRLRTSQFSLQHCLGLAQLMPGRLFCQGWPTAVLKGSADRAQSGNVPGYFRLDIHPPACK